MKTLFITLFSLFFTAFTSEHTNKPNFLVQGKTKETVVYLVRHAEKVTSNPDDQDPELTPSGYARAQALENYFKNIPVDALFSSPYKRTRLTLEPLAAGREIKTYNAHGAAALNEIIRNQYSGKTVLVAAHSNTILEIIEALGGKRPVPSIADTKYDYIFKVTLRPGKKAKVEAATYGAPTT